MKIRHEEVSRRAIDYLSRNKLKKKPKSLEHQYP